MFSSVSNRLRPKQLTTICKYHSVCSHIKSDKSNKSNNNVRHNYVVYCNLVPIRHLFGLPLKPPLSSSRVKKYNERRVLGYSKEQLFEVVSRVEDYHLFIPACVRSQVIQRHNSHIKADLEIGIPPLIWEKYTSKVTLVRPSLVIAKCVDGKLFKHLDTQWKFTDGVPGNHNTCTLDFSLSFEFRSLLHSQLAHMFFDEMARQTVNAFLKRVETLYGKQSFLVNNELTQKT